jgi:small conductance mechanosensitive channel
VGQIIETSDVCGRVDRITLRATEITRLDGQVVLIPNKDIFNKAVINHTASSVRRVDVETPVAAQSDLAETLRVAGTAVADIEGRDRDREIELFFKSGSDGNLILLVRFWIGWKDEAGYLRARSEAIQHLRRALVKSRL